MFRQRTYLDIFTKKIYSFSAFRIPFKSTFKKCQRKCQFKPYERLNFFDIVMPPALPLDSPISFYLGLACVLPVAWSQTFSTALPNLKLSSFFHSVQYSCLAYYFFSCCFAFCLTPLYPTRSLDQVDTCSNSMSFVLPLFRLISFLIAMPTFLPFDLPRDIHINSKIMSNT